MSGLGRAERKTNCDPRVPEAGDSDGVEPVQVRRHAPGNPCKRQSPRQDRSPGCGWGMRIADGSQSPEVERHEQERPRPIAFSKCFPLRCSVTPTKINRGGRMACEATRGPEYQKWSAHPSAGANLRRAGRKTQERRRKTRNRKEETLNLALPARPR